MTLFDFLLKTNQFNRRAERDQARMIGGFTLLLMLFFTAFSFYIGINENNEPLIQQISGGFTALLPLIAVLAMGVVTLVLVRQGRLDYASAGPVVMWYFSGVLLAFRTHFLYSDSGAALMFLVFLSGLFLRERGLLIGTIVGLVTLAVSAASYSGYSIDVVTYTNNTLGAALEAIGAAILIFLFLRSTRIEQVGSMARAYEERLTLANLTTQIAQRIQRRTELSSLLERVVEEILQNYTDIYHAQIFLINPQTRKAELVASTGEVGRTLMQRQHSLEVGSRSVIGQVTAGGREVIARAGSDETVHRRNEFLPDTVVEAAFPLKIGDDVIGALDLQSRLPAAFHETDLPIFQSLADSIAVAIDNARLFAETEQRLQENQRLVEQMRGAVSEVERLNRQLTQEAWMEYLETQGERLSMDVDIENQQTVRSDRWTPSLRLAVEENRLVQARADGATTVSLPLTVRNQVIGAMEFELENDQFAPENLDLVQAIAERFGLTVENTRLYEESRQAAVQEQRINDIAARFQSVATVDELLRITLSELSETLGAEQGAIRLGRFEDAGQEATAP